LEHFGEVLGLLSLNGDGHVSCKLKAKGQPFISFKARAELVDLATAELPWLKFSQDPRSAIATMKKHWPHLKFMRFTMNGADDVVAFQKWNGSREGNRMITMGRPGYTEKVLVGMKKAVPKIDPEQGFFILGPELPDISSTAVRKALRANDLSTLTGLLHPAVIRWCLDHGPYVPSRAVMRAVTGCGIPVSPKESSVAHDLDWSMLNKEPQTSSTKLKGSGASENLTES